MATPDFLEPDYSDQELRTTKGFDSTFDKTNALKSALKYDETEEGGKKAEKLKSIESSVSVMKSNADRLKRDIEATSDSIDSAFGIFRTTGAEKRTLDAIEQGGEDAIANLNEALKSAIKKEPEFVIINQEYTEAFDTAQKYFQNWSSEKKIEALVEKFEKAGANNYALASFRGLQGHNQRTAEVAEELDEPQS